MTEHHIAINTYIGDVQHRFYKRVEFNKRECCLVSAVHSDRLSSRDFVDWMFRGMINGRITWKIGIGASLSREKRIGEKMVGLRG